MVASTKDANTAPCIHTLPLWVISTHGCLHVSLLVDRFLYSDLQPLTELGIAPDPHPEGPSSLPAEAPPDIRKELASERRREGLRKAAVSTRLPRLTQVCIAVDWARCSLAFQSYTCAPNSS